jgi:uncharacterized membrane protein YjgN (DUF898 family)
MDAIAPTYQPRISVRREPFRFTGNTREYFGIWIVNILLTIVTLGIYSAWAKVRRQRYFYGNTHLAGSTFDYHARPIKILIGRIIVLVLLGVYNLTIQVQPVIGLIILVLIILLVPWFVMRGMRFNARVTSYRNVRFDFTGGYWGAFQAYILGTALIYLTGGILAPLASQWMWRYTFNNLRYGDRPIACEPRLDKLYGQWWRPALIVLLGSIALVGTLIGGSIMVWSSNSFDGFDTDGMLTLWLPILLVAMYVPFIALFLVAKLIYDAGVRNVVFNETVIDNRHMLASSIHRGRYAWISVTNLLATICTLGLARPWAAIRMAQYMSTVTALDTTGSLDDYFSTVKFEGAAVGAEFMDVEGFDVGF